MSTDTYVLPELNTELISDLLTWAAADHEKMDEFMSQFEGWGNWDQSSWAQEVRNGVCQTAYCMAGQAVVQSGYKVLLEKDEDESIYNSQTGRWEKPLPGRTYWSAENCYPVVKNGKDEKGNQKYRRTGENTHIETTATELLGLHHFEALAFFNGTNSLSYLIYLAIGFAKARGVELDISPKIVGIAMSAYGDDHTNLGEVFLNYNFGLYYNEIMNRVYELAEIGT